MSAKQFESFESVSHRVIYCLKVMYSEFAPVASRLSSERNQRELHGLMAGIIDNLYDNPDLLELPGDKDEAFEYHICNNRKPALDKIYLHIYKSLFEFYKLLYTSALHGEVRSGKLLVDNNILKEYKAVYKIRYKKLLGSVGMDVEKTKNRVIIAGSDNILQSMKLLAEGVPVNVSPWRPYALANFALCSFTDGFEYLPGRVDAVNNLNGLLDDLHNRCAERGYERSIKCSLTATSCDFNISFKNNIGGFEIIFNPRKYNPFIFGTSNGIGEKAMIEDFANLDSDLQRYFVEICKICNNCLNCTKNGKNKKFAVEVEYNGEKYNLCPSFPRHGWHTINRGLIDVLFKYHDAQNKYGVDRKI